MGLKGGLLEASIMLNLDTEDDDELTIGCAGGIDVTASGLYTEKEVPSNSFALKVTVNGLTGGHSGMDIHRGRGNANKLMNRLLMRAVNEFGISISTINGGSLRNAIPRESFAIVCVGNDQEQGFKAWLSEFETEIKQEHNTTDPNLKVLIDSVESPAKVLKADFQIGLLRAVYGCPVGIYRMSPDIDGLVQTSNNLARVLVENGEYTVQCLTRSSVDSEKLDEAESIKALFELIGSKVEFGGSYPGWAPRPDAAIVKTMSDLYKKLFNEDAHVMACHAGLECGILGTNYPEMEMISFGPNIRGAHSPDECVQISSVHKYWNLLIETLMHIPEA